MLNDSLDVMVTHSSALGVTVQRIMTENSSCYRTSSLHVTRAKVSEKPCLQPYRKGCMRCNDLS